MQITPRQHTVLALLLFCSLIAVFHLGRMPRTPDEIAGIADRYEMYPPAPRLLYSALAGDGDRSVLQMRAISIVCSALGLTFSWLIARRIASPSLALTAPALLAGANFWNVSARSGLPDMMIITLMLIGAWAMLQPSESYPPALRKFRLVIIAASALFIFFATPLPLKFYYSASDILNIRFPKITFIEALSALPFIVIIPFALQFAFATRKNKKMTVRSRNMYILILISAVIAICFAVMYGNIGYYWAPFAIISGIRILELASASEVSPRIGWIAVTLSYLTAIIASAMPWFGENAWNISVVIAIIWGLTAAVGLVAPIRIVRQLLARIIISAGVIIPAMLLISVAARNLRGNSLMKTENESVYSMVLTSKKSLNIPLQNRLW